MNWFSKAIIVQPEPNCGNPPNWFLTDPVGIKIYIQNDRIINFSELLIILDSNFLNVNESPPKINPPNWFITCTAKIQIYIQQKIGSKNFRATNYLGF